MIKVINEQQVFQEAASVLMEHMSLPKVVRFWAAWQIGQGNYLELREQLFGKETVATLYDKVYTYQEERDQPVKPDTSVGDGAWSETGPSG